MIPVCINIYLWQGNARVQIIKFMLRDGVSEKEIKAKDFTDDIFYCITFRIIYHGKSWIVSLSSKFFEKILLQMRIKFYDKYDFAVCLLFE